MSWLAYATGALLFFAGVLLSIALHEVGHLLPAKRFGVKVTQYFVGFGRTMWSVRRGETEYGLKLFPVGGYVRLVGMFPPGKGGDPSLVRRSSTGPFRALIEDARAAEYEHVRPGDQERLFYRKPVWQKLVVMSGGPVTNLILAFGLFAVVFMGFGAPEPRPVVESVADCVIPISEAPRRCQPSDPVTPARAAGLRVGDEIVAFNGQPVDSWTQLTTLIRTNGESRAAIGVVRAGERITLTTRTTVAERPGRADPTALVDVGFLGVAPEMVLDRKGPGYVAATMWDYTVLTGQALLDIPEKMVGVWNAAFSGAERDVESPVSVVGASRFAGELATQEELTTADRVASVLSLLGGVNLFVALFNFVPLLPLDGGHIAGALYEGARRQLARLRGRPDPGPADVAKLLPLAYAAATVIVVMGVLLVYADIVNPVRFAG